MSSSEGPRGAAVRAAALCLGLAAAAGTASAAVDLAALQVLPQHGQTADQMRRDRYECHNWAVEQTGVVPRAPAAQPAQPAAKDRRDQEDQRTEKVNRTIGGAAIGAAIGSLVHGDYDRHHAGRSILAGAAIGAAVGAATTPRQNAESKAAKRGAEPSPGENDYLRALSACMEGRGYKVVLPGDRDESTASDSS